MIAQTTHEDQETLERLIDKYGAQEVLATLGDIAREKAEHVRANWGEELLGRAWDKVGYALDRAAHAPAIKAKALWRVERGL